MNEGGPKTPQGVTLLGRRETQHKAFVESKKFDAIIKRMPERPFKVGDLVNIRGNARICKVHEVSGDEVSVDYESEGEGLAGRSTLKLNDVRLAEDYERDFLKWRSATDAENA